MKLKPKLLFFDCCKGKRKEKKFWESKGERKKNRQCFYTLSQDFLYAYSCAPATISYADTEDTDGLSLYTFYLSQRLKEMKRRNKSLLTALTGVTKDLCNYMQTHQAAQAPNFSSYLTEDVYFM